MRTGKLPPELLARLLASVASKQPGVLIGPRPGEDAAVIEVNGTRIVLTSDPVTFVSARAGWYAVHVNANDVAAMGAVPRWFSATILLPPSVDEAELDSLFAQLRSACEEVGAALVTGHTEVTDAVTRTVVSGTMAGVLAEAPISSGGALAGDVLLLAGAAGAEGAAILAAEAAAELRSAGLSQSTLDEAASLLESRGISVLPAVRLLLEFRPHALHDVTEGGVASAVREVTAASGTGVVLEADAVPLPPVVATVCKALALDPLGLISSGLLVAALSQSTADAAVAALTRAGITAAVAGRFTAAGALRLSAHGQEVPLPEFDRDELARYLEGRSQHAAPVHLPGVPPQTP